MSIICKAWDTLAQWANDNHNSKIVRVNALQSIFDLATRHTQFKASFNQLITELQCENIPSLNARIKKLNKAT